MLGAREGGEHLATSDQVLAPGTGQDQPGPQRPPLAAEMDPSSDCRYYINENKIDEAPEDCKAILEALLHQPVYTPVGIHPQKVEPQNIKTIVPPETRILVQETEFKLEPHRDINWEPLLRHSTFEAQENKDDSDDDAD